MTKYELSKDANQSFDTSVNGRSFSFVFHSFRGMTYVDAYVDGEPKEMGSPAVPNRSIFGGAVNNAAGGEFLFVCRTDDYPYYENFDGLNCFFAFKPY